MSDRANSRQHKRFTVQLVAEINVGDRTVKAQTKDMSRGGICMFSPASIDPGSAVDLSLSLVLGNNAFSESLAIRGRIIWCTPLEDQRFQVGASFIDIDHEKSGYLDMFLRFLEQEIQGPRTSEPVPAVTQFDTGDADKP